MSSIIAVELFKDNSRAIFSWDFALFTLLSVTLLALVLFHSHNTPSIIDLSLCGLESITMYIPYKPVLVYEVGNDIYKFFNESSFDAPIDNREDNFLPAPISLFQFPTIT